MDRDKSCSNCKHLKQDKEIPKIFGKSYLCNIINQILSSTRIIIFKLEWLSKFSCNFHDYSEKESNS